MRSYDALTVLHQASAAAGVNSDGAEVIHLAPKTSGSTQ
jgi:hypothetical protein